MFYKRKNAFTLVEVLLVIAIIALLIAIITPSLIRARESARSVYCRSLLKGYSAAHYSYFLDTEELLPVSVQDPEMKPWFTLDQFRSYLDLKPLSGEYKRRNPRNPQEYKPSYPQRFICPSASYALDNPEDSLYPIDRSYGLNAHLYSQSSNIKTTNIRNPGDRVCISDGMDWWFNYWECDKYLTYGETWLPPKTYGEAAFRHSDKTNTIYWDGHCESMSPERLKKTLKPWISRKYR